MNSLKHLQHENMRQMKLQQQSQHGPLPAKTIDEEIREVFQVKELTPGDNVNFTDGKSTQVKVQLKLKSNKLLLELLEGTCGFNLSFILFYSFHFLVLTMMMIASLVCLSLFSISIFLFSLTKEWQKMCC